MKKKSNFGLSMTKNTNLVNQTNSTYVSNRRAASNLWKTRVNAAHAGHFQSHTPYLTVIRLQKLNQRTKKRAQSILGCHKKNLSGVQVMRIQKLQTGSMNAMADICNILFNIFMKMVFQPQFATHKGTKGAKIHSNTKVVQLSANKLREKISITKLDQRSITNN